jgi:hypothetical protein
MSCSNCFNGCTEITSDKCVRYTGANIPELGIQNGDTLLFVEQALAQFIISALDGTGITPVIDPSIICNAVSVNLPTSGNLTLIDIISGLVKSICDLQEEIDTIIVDVTEINNVLAELNAFYDIPSSCFTGVTIDPESTHSVLQALLDTFCALSISLPNTYVLQSELNSEVTAILENEGVIGPVIKEYTKMVPYVAYPWFAPIDVVSGNFGSTGEGYAEGPYQYVNFCNGQNGTPDMRGRVPAGLTTGMLGGSFDPQVNPNTPGNPNYEAIPTFTKTGVNFVALEENQLPAHTHSTTVNIIDPQHQHVYPSSGPDGGYVITNGPPNDVGIKTDTDAFWNYSAATPPASTGLKGTGPGQNVTVTNLPTGNNIAHANTQPTIGCYYIMYIPPA